MKKKKNVFSGIILVFMLGITSGYFFKSKINAITDSIVDFVHNDPSAIGIIKFLSSPYNKLVRPDNTNPEYVLNLYQLMKDIHDVFEVVQIEYWADGGTLLGAIRHKGLIPWDDGLNLMIHEKSVDKFNKCGAPILRKLGYEVKAHKTEYIQVIASAETSIASNDVPPTCEIYIAKEKNNRLVIENWDPGIDLAYWKPLKQYQFGSFFVWGNFDPIPYLNELYGKNWWDLGAPSGSHEGQSKEYHSKATVFLVNGNDYQPAQPTKPIISKVKYILKYSSNLDQECKPINIGQQ